VPIGQCHGREVTTIEGVVQRDGLSPLANAFVERSGVQCGFCTPGMIMSSEYLLRHQPNPTEEQIREALAGNICRCTGYTAIVEAVQQAAEQLSSDSGEKR
jgi:carbon-monoxide dehydrogenase small subunit